MQVKQIKIGNFKSLRDAKIDLGQFNAIVGENATGKTNLVDAFLLLKKIYVEHDINPFSYWWGYNNAVWKGKEELPIIFEFYFETKINKKTYTGSFSTVFTGVGGRFEIVRESLKIDGILTLGKEGEHLTIKREREYVDKLWEEIKEEKVLAKKWKPLAAIAISRKSIDVSRKNKLIRQIEKHPTKSIFNVIKREFESIIVNLPFYELPQNYFLLF